MTEPTVDLPKLRGAFLLILAIGISILFFRMIESFVLALVLAAIFAGLVHPFYRRLLGLFGDRKKTAAVATVVLSLLVVVLPLMGFLAVMVNEAININESAGPWVDRQLQDGGGLRGLQEKVPVLERLAPYQDRILQKAAEFSGQVATFAAQGLAAGTKGTARFFLLLFVMLYAMYYFLTDGRALLERILAYTPLATEDKRRMLDTFTSVTRASLKGTLIIGIVQGALGGLAFGIAGVPGAVFWAAVMAVLSVLPGVGPALIWVPAVVYLAVDGRVGAAVGLALWCALVVSTIDNVLRPRLVGKGTKMPDLLVLLGTLGGLILFGAVGIIIGPIIAALFVTVWELWGGAARDTMIRSPAQGVASSANEEPRTG